MGRVRRAVSTALMASAAVLVSVAPAAGAGSTAWTLTASPLTAAVGVTTTFTFTVSNFDTVNAIGCVLVRMPEAINAGDVRFLDASSGQSWTASRSGQDVTLQVGSGSQKVRDGEWLMFSVTGVPRQQGAFAVPATAASDHNCAVEPTAPTSTPVIVVSGGVVATAVPTPLVTPTPPPAVTAPISPTPQPAVTATPILPSLISPTVPPSVPATGVTSTAAPGAAAPVGPSPLGAPAATGTPAPAAPRTVPAGTPAPSAGSLGVPAAAPPPAAPSAGVEPAALTVARGGEADSLADGVSFGPAGLIDGLTVWAIPGAVLGGPGLIVIVWVVIQMSVAAAWVPAVARLRGKRLARSSSRQSVGS